MFLARNYENQTENKITTGESISGAMSEDFDLIANEAGISHRAEKFIEQARKAVLSGPVRLGRG